MPRRPGDNEPEPPGGRAAERRQAFLEGRFPSGQEASSSASAHEDEDDNGEEDKEGRPRRSGGPTSRGDAEPGR